MTNPSLIVPIETPSTVTDAFVTRWISALKSYDALIKVVRKVDTVTEISGIESNREIKLTPKYKWDSIKDEYINYEFEDEKESIFKQISVLRHIPEVALKEEMKNRTSIIKWMVNQNINEYNKVSEIIYNYYTNPEQVLANVKFEDY